MGHRPAKLNLSRPCLLPQDLGLDASRVLLLHTAWFRKCLPLLGQADDDVASRLEASIAERVRPGRGLAIMEGGAAEVQHGR